MFFTLLAFPFILMFFLWLLPWLEERTIAPQERAMRIRGFLEHDEPDAIEKEVAELLATSKAVRSMRKMA